MGTLSDLAEQERKLRRDNVQTRKTRLVHLPTFLAQLGKNLRTVLVLGLVSSMCWVVLSGYLPIGYTSNAIFSGSNPRVTAHSVGSEKAQAPSLTNYTITDLGTLGGAKSYAYDINNADQVVGEADIPGNTVLSHAFLWQNGTMQDLGTFGGQASIAFGINDAGQVVGGANVPSNAYGRPFLWQNGVMTDLGRPAGCSSSVCQDGEALGVNNSGQVVGETEVQAVGRPWHAFLWQNGMMQDLGTLGGSSSRAYRINSTGQIVGWAYTASSAKHAFLWQNGAMQDLGTFGGNISEALDINDQGKVVGYATTASGARRAFLWQNGLMQDLGTLGGGIESIAHGINNFGQVVGWALSKAVLWQNGTIQDLNNLVPPGSGWTLIEAWSINDAGKIVGYGAHNGQTHAFLLTPDQGGCLSNLFQGPAQGTSAAGATRDTNSFPTLPSPQILVQEQEETEDIPLLEDPPNLIPPLAQVGANEVDDRSTPERKGAAPSAPNPVPGSSFPGLTYTGQIPADAITAAGPNHLMGLVNSDFGIFDKSGTLQKRISANLWFQNVLPGLGAPPLGAAFDPQILYDHQNGRWVMVWLAKNSSAQQGWFLISVSDDADPNGTWCNWAVSSSLNGTTPAGNWSDYEGLGTDSQAIYLTGNQLRFSNSAFDYAKIRVFRKTELYSLSCPPLTYTDFWDLRDPTSPSLYKVSTVRPAITFGTPGVEYLLNDSPFTTGTYMTLWRLSNPLNTCPTLTAMNVPVTASTSPPNASQLGGGTLLIDVGGRRIRNLVYRNGSIWTAHSVADSTGQFARARYVRISVTGSTALEDVSFGLNNCWLYYPAITVDSNGNMVMVYNQSCTTSYAGIHYTGRKATDTNLQASAVLKSGEANYINTGLMGVNRWGDYNGIAVDPADTSKVWMFAEYATLPANTWDTYFGQVTFDCTYSFSPANQSFGASGGTGNVNVTTASGCSWTAVSNSNWVTITSGSTGSGNGTVSYSVASNTSSSSRTGTITIAGQIFTVTQGGAPCVYSISPTSQSFGASGGSSSVNVTAPSGCSWVAASNVSWVATTSGSTGSGNGTVTYSVLSNASANSRTGTLTIAGQSFTVTQSGVCTYSISPTSQSFTASAGSGSVSVTAASGCSWAAVSNTNWITITAGNSGNGNGAVSYSVSPNTSPNSRTSIMTIAGQTFTVTQAGAAICTYSIAPASQSFGAGVGTGNVSVVAPSGCGWTATSNAPWIAVASGGGGTGNGIVSYSVAANAGAARTGTMTIAGQTFVVTQASGCTFTISPTSQNFSASGGSGSVNLTASNAACTWTATSNASWITLANTSGAGSGTVTYSVATNTTNNLRSGTIVIAGTLFTVMQDAPTFTLTVASTPSSGISITVSPSDNNGQSSGTTPFTRTYNSNTSVTLTAPAAAGGNNFQKWQRDGVDLATAQTVTVMMDANRTMTAVYMSPGPLATYDPTLKAPKCSVLGSGCDSGTLLNGRDNITGGAEPNQPNTINNSCADGTGGSYHVDESIDKIKVSTLDGSNFAPGKQVRIEVTVWAYSGFASDRLDLYYAANASNPTWILITTLTPTVAGTQVLSTTYTLPSGSLQAVRANFRYSGAASPCSSSSYDDRDDLILAVNDPSPPILQTLTVASTPSSGVSITVSPSDNNGQGSGTTPFTRTYNNNTSVTLTAPAAAGGNNFQKWQRDGVDLAATQTVSVTMDANHTMTAVYSGGSSVVSATYDSVLKAPKCSVLGSGCDSGTLLNGRDNITGGAEPNQPNTINSSCADGTGGSYHVDESIDRIKVSTLDGSNFAPGKQVRIEVTVWAYSGFASDQLDLYYAANANNPSWTLIATLTPTVAGAQVLSATYTLPSGSLQAVRANFRYNGAASLCSNGNYDDHDDLIFAVNDPSPPVFRTLTVVSTPSSGVSITVSPSDNNGQSSGTTPFTRTYNNNMSVTLAASATAGGNNFQKWQRDGVDLAATQTVSVTMDANHTMTAVYSGGPSVMSATYDSVLKAPKCGVLGNGCDSGALLNGRDNITGGAEPNQPNTINNSCADGTGGSYHVDESIDRIKVSTLDGSNFAPGKQVKIEVTVWAYISFTSDQLDLYYAADASNPTWILITTLTPTGAGAQTLSATYTLPSGSLQAVRARFRYGGAASPCGVDSYNDHDDLIFAVGGTVLFNNPTTTKPRSENETTIENPAGIRRGQQRRGQRLWDRR